MTSEKHADDQDGFSSDARSAKPILFLDVDGPLNPYAAPIEDHPDGYGTHRMRPASWAQDYPPVRLPGGQERVPTLRVWLNPAHGKALLSLPVELVWATTWEHEANEWIAPHLHLPDLPVLAWHEHDVVRWPDDGTFWKTQPVAAYAAGRPFAWFDDQIEPEDIRWCEDNYPAPTLLLPIDPAVGLRDADFDAVANWAREL
ncbi:HAD domain-containing protein [Actinospica robiniae]|uniref:HAD domain-containing protein n=1 Tax=Actinospica robiniae TaxID=304901 RepID=UPI00041FA514|nr:HAD domain-containing protein [Actinospica robiniae]